MNMIRKVILISGLGVFVAFTLFPPWLYTAYVTGTRHSQGFRSEKDAGHHFIFTPPSPENDAPPFGTKIDVSRLVLEWVAVVAITGMVLLLNRFMTDDQKKQRAADKTFGVMAENDRFEEGVKMYDKAKRARLGAPPQASANTSTPPRFTSSAQFAAAFEAAFLRGDFDYFLEALKEADRHIYVPEMKKYINASKLGYADAAERLEWFRHAIAGTVPPNVKPQDKTPPQPQPSAGAPPPPVGMPPPPPAATPPPKAGVSNRPMLTLNTAAMGLIAKKLGASISINTLLRQARGRAVINFADGSEVQLSEQLFKDPVQAAKTLAHEIGHLIDSLPASGFGQKLAGRIAPLGDFRKVFGDDLADWSMGGGKKMNLNKINQLIIDELVGLSKKWRGDFTYQPGTYRSLGSELYADFISATLNDPMWTAKNAPYATLGFLNALEQKPEVDYAYKLVVSLVQGGSLYKALAEADRSKRES